MTIRTISSQRYLDPSIVAAKVASADFEVQVVLVEIAGETYRVIVDGHHSLAAARNAGVAPEYTPAHPEIQGEATANPETYLADHQLDSDYYDVETGLDVW